MTEQGLLLRNRESRSAVHRCLPAAPHVGTQVRDSTSHQWRGRGPIAEELLAGSRKFRSSRRPQRWRELPGGGASWIPRVGGASLAGFLVLKGVAHLTQMLPEGGLSVRIPGG